MEHFTYIVRTGCEGCCVLSYSFFLFLIFKGFQVSRVSKLTWCLLTSTDLPEPVSLATSAFLIFLLSHRVLGIPFLDHGAVSVWPLATFGNVGFPTDRFPMLWWMTPCPCTHGKDELDSVILRRKGRGRAEEAEEEEHMSWGRIG